MLILKTKYLMGQMHFEFEEFKKAKMLFEEALNVFKAKELFQYILKCDFYLLACNLSLVKQTNLNEFCDAYSNVIKKAKVLDIPLNGRSIGKLEWIIGETLISKDGAFKKRGLDVHLRKGYL